MFMWQQQLKDLENKKKWDAAILFMESIIAESPTVDAYLAMSYLLMNLLVEENYDPTKRDYYAALSEKYFKKGYKKFSQNTEYLFFMGRIASMSEWYVGLNTEDVFIMLKTPSLIEPTNQLYLWNSYGVLNRRDSHSKALIDACVEKIVSNSMIDHMLRSKGALGVYILDLLQTSYARANKKLN